MKHNHHRYDLGCRCDVCRKASNAKCARRVQRKQAYMRVWLVDECQICGAGPVEAHHFNGDGGQQMRTMSWADLHVELPKTMGLCKACHTRLHNGG